MTLQVNKSTIDALPFNFADEVEKYRAARDTHARTIGEAAPFAVHPLVERAVLRIPPPPDTHPDEQDAQFDRFHADYDVIDDTPPPPPPPTVAEKKAMLAALAAQAADEARERVLPSLKRRFQQFQATAAGNKMPASRSADDAAAIAAFEDRNSKFVDIEGHLATLEVQIHDLPDEAAIDAWRPAAFPY